MKRLFPKQVEIPFKLSKEDENIIVMGRYASALTSNPALDAAFKRIEAEIFNAWKTSPPKDEEKREHLYYRMEGLAQVKLKLAGLVNNMLLEEKMAKQIQRQSSEEETQEEN